MGNAVSAVNVSGYGGKCCHCFRIWWEVLPIFNDIVEVPSVLLVLQLFQDMEESAVNVSHYGWKCCKYSTIWWEVLKVLPLFQYYGEKCCQCLNYSEC